MEVDEDVPVHVPSKIRFKEDVVVSSHDVKCVFVDSLCCQVDLGLLSEWHYYQVHFFMPHSLGNDVDVPPIQTPAVLVTQLKKYEGREGNEVTLEVKCSDHGYLEEKIVFENSRNETVSLKVCGKVMKSHLGTPSLKGGVKLLHKCAGNMSDAATEWQGFE